MATIGRWVAELGSWVAKLVARLLAAEAHGFKSRHLSKIQNGRQSGQKSGRCIQKNKKASEISLGGRYFEPKLTKKSLLMGL